MRSSWSSWSVPLLLLLGVVAASGLALVVEDDSTDTVLGAVAGALAVLALFACVLQVLSRRAWRRDRDEEVLDDLEPLRAARRDPRR